MVSNLHNCTLATASIFCFKLYSRSSHDISPATSHRSCVGDQRCVYFSSQARKLLQTPFPLICLSQSYEAQQMQLNMFSTLTYPVVNPINHFLQPLLASNIFSSHAYFWRCWKINKIIRYSYCWNSNFELKFLNLQESGSCSRSWTFNKALLESFSSISFFVPPVLKPMVYSTCSERASLRTTSLVRFDVNGCLKIS